MPVLLSCLATVHRHVELAEAVVREVKFSGSEPRCVAGHTRHLENFSMVPAASASRQ